MDIYPEDDAEWREVKDDWRSLDVIVEKRFGLVPYISDLLLILAAVFAVLGTIGRVGLALASDPFGAAKGVTVAVAAGAFVYVLLFCALLAAVGYGLRVMMALWGETWAVRTGRR